MFSSALLCEGRSGGRATGSRPDLFPCRPGRPETRSNQAPGYGSRHETPGRDDETPAGVSALPEAALAARGAYGGAISVRDSGHALDVGGRRQQSHHGPRAGYRVFVLDLLLHGSTITVLRGVANRETWVLRPGSVLMMVWYFARRGLGARGSVSRIVGVNLHRGACRSSSEKFPRAPSGRSALAAAECRGWPGPVGSA